MNKKNMISVAMLVICLFLTSIIPAYANDTKCLYFEEKQGDMVWNNIRGDDGNWFMSFRNMLPGEFYEDQLKIKNGSSKSYELYMQIIPLEQSDVQDALLKRIEMETFQDEKLIYKGNATGEPGTADFQNIIPIGVYEPQRESLIDVKLKLEDSIGIEYCDILTKVDWKFMVREISQEENPPIVEITPPKTGDSAKIEALIYVLIGAALLLLLVNLFKRKKE